MADYYAQAYLLVRLSNEDLFEEMEVEEVICDHPMEDGWISCPLCGTRREDRVRKTKTKRWREPFKNRLPEHMHELDGGDQLFYHGEEGIPLGDGMPSLLSTSTSSEDREDDGPFLGYPICDISNERYHQDRGNPVDTPWPELTAMAARLRLALDSLGLSADRPIFQRAILYCSP